MAGDKYCSECGFPVGVADTASDADPLLGKTLAGGYRIVEFIAEGSMGRVYRAEQANLGRAVAVKIMNAALLALPAMVDRFRTEAKAASILNHPNCMRVYDFGETPDKRPYIVMELLHGQDLELILQGQPLLPMERVLDVTLQMLRALEEAHGQGVVHRDLKPANVFLMAQRGGGDLVKVVDFGLAKLRSAISGSTMTGIICGTPAYMAPEQATGSETDGRTDLYSVGVMLFEMITGKLPFSSDDATELLRNQVFDAPPPLASIHSERVLPGMQQIVDRALAKNKADRYASAEAFSADLSELSERKRGSTRPVLKTCGECGGSFPVAARFCGECGAPAPRDSLPNPVEAAAPISAPPRVPSQSSARIALPVRDDAEGPQTYRMQWGREETGPRKKLDLRSEGVVAPPSDRVKPSRRASHHPVDETGETAATLVHLEQLAARKSEAGDHRGAVTALQRAIIHIKNDMDRGELDDPLGAMTLFTGKLGETLLMAGEPEEALNALREAVSLMAPGVERVRLLLLMSRAAREMGREEDASRYLRDAEGEAEERMARPSSAPASDAEERSSGVNLSQRRIDTPASSRRRSM